MPRHKRKNRVAVLESAQWKTKGAHDAADLLRIKPSTLLSRMSCMGLQRP